MNMKAVAKGILMGTVAGGLLLVGAGQGTSVQAAAKPRPVLSGYYYVNAKQKLVLHRVGDYILIGDYRAEPNGHVKTYKITNLVKSGKTVQLSYHKMVWDWRRNSDDAAISEHYVVKSTHTIKFKVNGKKSLRALFSTSQHRGLRGNQNKPGKLYTLTARKTSPVKKWVTGPETKRLNAENAYLKKFAADQAAKGLQSTQPAESPAQLKKTIKRAVNYDVKLMQKPLFGNNAPQHIQA